MKETPPLPSYRWYRLLYWCYYCLPLSVPLAVCPRRRKSSVIAYHYSICILIGMAFYKIPWKDYELAITNNIAGVATAIIILLIIGALSGIWMISGVVPTLIYYGMQIIHPSFFLASTCIICALISVMTGSFVDYHCYHRYRPDGYRKGARFWRRLDCRSHYFQGHTSEIKISPFIRNHHPGFLPSQILPLFSSHPFIWWFTTVPSLVIYANYFSL